MGDEAQKRNTDCVYFLASPLTCKKGADCEYRHSEAARVNPRDCWYWLSGNCLNASCSFRHPPLDGRPGVSVSNPSQVAGGTSSTATSTVATTAAAAPSTPSTSTTVSASSNTSKSTVPCYFFSQGYCAKGVKCSFSHGPSTQFRKEATTYQRPHVNEPPANGEGNGVSHAKQQSQERKPGAQIRPIRDAVPSREAGYFPSNVYKLSASGVPPPSGKRFFGNTGERLEQNSQVGGLKPVHNIDDTTRNAQVVENRISQAHFSSECVDQFPTNDKGSTKGQRSHLDLARTRESRQPSATYVARTSDILPGSEIQDPFYELEGQLSAGELHANDLRNHLKRKKSDTAYSGQLRDFRAKEFSKDRVIGGRLASRAVSVAESKDVVPVNSKRARQEKESSTFSGPKSLAQIKAEKSKAVTQGSPEAEDSMDDCKTVELDPGELKGVDEESAFKLPGSLLPESCKGPQGDHHDTQFEETKSEQKNVSSEHEGTSQELRPGVGINDSNGLSSEIVPLGVSKEAEAAINHSSEMHFAYISKTRHSLGNEETLGGKKRALHTEEGTRSETDNVSADELMEDGSEALENAADTEYASEYDEEDDFHKKLGSFLS
ncbi:hypothetical protein L7F22_066175 [Adiantum nelumboides]|nr:hypothetical protein [Adiantum nelumboides]